MVEITRSLSPSQAGQSRAQVLSPPGSLQAQKADGSTSVCSSNSGTGIPLSHPRTRTGWGLGCSGVTGQHSWNPSQNTAHRRGLCVPGTESDCAAGPVWFREQNLSNGWQCWKKWCPLGFQTHRWCALDQDLGVSACAMSGSTRTRAHGRGRALPLRSVQTRKGGEIFLWARAKPLLGEVCQGPPDPFTEKRHLGHFPA